MARTLNRILHTACGCIGRQQIGALDENDTTTWFTGEDGSTPIDGPEQHTVMATWTVLDETGNEIDTLSIDGASWRTLENQGLLCEDELFEEVQRGVTLEDALAAQVNLLANTYRHCGQSWRDEWSCACNDRCPVCNKEIEPAESETLRSLEEGQGGIYTVIEALGSEGPDDADAGADLESLHTEA
jgi:hypothetical protein